MKKIVMTTVMALVLFVGMGNVSPVSVAQDTGTQNGVVAESRTTNPESSSTSSEDDVNFLSDVVGIENIEIDEVEDETYTEDIVYEGFDPDIDYSEQIANYMYWGDIEAAKAAIEARNLKIIAFDLSYYLFTYEELNDLSRIICQEAGSSWIPAEWKMGVGEVVLNRVASPEFPDSIHGVITQSIGQYGHTWQELSNPYCWFYTTTINEGCVEAALRLFSGERVFNDPSVVFQAQFTQGSGVCKVMEDPCGLYTPTYFCYSNYPSLYQSIENEA